MPAKALASEALQIERQEIEKANLAARRTDWAQEQAKTSDKEGFFTCFKCGSKKTHFYQM
jgi:DNA-directed RNA polymerase subunit M/transcription elongation factor TFIIS